MSNCLVCPFECNVDRTRSLGRCRSSDIVHIVRAEPHFWEEPCVSGSKGSGTVFFSGCSLRCVFCQNSKISREEGGKSYSVPELEKLFLRYSETGVHNINLVTPTHYTEQIVSALEKVKPQLGIPVVWNSSGYEKPETLRRLEGLVDVYLADSKFYSSEVSEKYAACPDYFKVNVGAIGEMLRQQPENVYEDGLIKKGVMVRHLVLPSNTSDSRRLLAALKENFSEKLTLSLMCQYVPSGSAEKFPEINRRLRRREFATVYNYAMELGFENGYFQEFASASEAFIPDFET